MPAAQPSIDSLEAAVTSLTAKLAAITAENESLKKEIAAGVLTDAQEAQVQKMTEAVLGKSQGPSGLSS
jgi:cell division protein FtsB